MRFIISPAKKMNVVDSGIAWADLPRFADRADELADVVRGLTYDQAKALWQCSDTLANLNFERFRTLDVHDAALLTPAVVAYEGIQYQHLAAQVMDERQLAWLQEHLRILSGFYGVLCPLDGVVPYRLEMQAKLAVGSARNLYEYWGDMLYQALAEETDVIVNLASVEYAKAVVPFAQADVGMRTVTCLFGDLGADGRLKQRSTAAKAARGSMVRWCAENQIEHVEDLKSFNVLDHRFVSELSTPNKFVFVQS